MSFSSLNSVIYSENGKSTSQTVNKTCSSVLPQDLFTHVYPVVFDDSIRGIPHMDKDREHPARNRFQRSYSRQFSTGLAGGTGAPPPLQSTGGGGGNTTSLAAGADTQWPQFAGSEPNVAREGATNATNARTQLSNVGHKSQQLVQKLRCVSGQIRRGRLPGH